MNTDYEEFKRVLEALNIQHTAERHNDEIFVKLMVAGKPVVIYVFGLNGNLLDTLEGLK